MIDNNDSNRYVISADIGGSHITAAVIDMASKQLLDHTITRLTVNSKGTWAQILGIWADALKGAKTKFNGNVGMVAMAMPGPFDYKNGVSWIRGLDKYESIYGLNIGNYLSTELNILRENIIFRNDAEAFLHGEVVAGAGIGYKKILGITLGTGLGSALSSNGITVDVNRGSSLFRATIADDYLSTRWFVKRYLQLTSKTIANVRELALIADSDSDAQKVFKEFGTNLVLFLKGFIADESPDLLIIGGNIVKAAGLFLTDVKNEIDKNFSDMTIKVAELGENSAMIGVAAAFEDITT